MKKELENAPPEPREPAAREARIQWMCVLEHPVNNQTPNVMTEWVKRSDAEAYSAELRAERDKWMTRYYNAEEYLCSCNINRKNDPAWQHEWTYVCDFHQNHPDDEEVISLSERAEASERSLLQARAELIPAVQSLLEWMPKYSIGSSGYMRQERVMKALLASTSAPSSEAAK